MLCSIFLVSLATAAKALNDWSKPCLAGTCSYDIPDSAGSSSGSLKIWGLKDAISDITAAAGWEILDCAPDQLTQNIRLVCHSADANAVGCSHLYESTGAEGKIVRLPESCGKNAFARVVRAWVPEDQSIPLAIASKVTRRDGQQPQVKALRIDTNFAAIDPSKVGAVKFALKGANIKGAKGDIDTSAVGPQRRSRIYINNDRGLFDFVGDAINAIKNLDDFDVDKSKTLSPFSANKNFTLLDQQLLCPPITASVKIDVDSKVNAVATIGVAASGTIIPPKLEDFAVITSLTADLDGSLTMLGGLSGTLDSGKIKIFEVGVPGLDFPGVLTIGPTFEVSAQATAALDLNVDLTVGLNYHVEKAQLIFPPSGKKPQQAGRAFNVGDTPLKLSISPSVNATGSIEAHLIPSLNLKISALGDIVEAGVFLELDASTKMQLELDGKAQGSVIASKREISEPAIKGRWWAGGYKSATPMPSSSSVAPMAVTTRSANAPSVKTAVVQTTSVNATSVKVTSVQMASVKPTSTTTTSLNSTSVDATSIKTTSVRTSVKPTFNAPVATTVASSVAGTKSLTSIAPTSTIPVKAVITDQSANFDGCFEIDAGLDVNAGADASFFGLFDTGTKVSLFSRQFQIFKKCFGNTTKRSVTLPPSRLMRAVPLDKRVLSCAASEVGDVVTVADQIVQAGTITPI